MPARNRDKIFFENGFYHLYNRGVDKREIFIDHQDFTVFLHFLRKYLTPKPIEETFEIPNSIRIAGYKPHPYETLFGKIDLIAYCLMPNHFHLLLQQKLRDSMTKLLKRVSNSYVTYFNKKYKRVGPLFQGTYKAANIDNEHYLLHVSRYIHLNPILCENADVSASNEDRPRGPSLLRDGPQKEWSSYPDYLGTRKTDWLKPEVVLSYFNKTGRKSLNQKKINTYKNFVEDYAAPPEEIIGPLALE